MVMLCIAWNATVAAEREPAKLVDQVIAASGIDAHLEQVADLAAAEIEGRRAALPPGEYERLRDAILPDYAPAKLRKAVVATFMNHLDTEKLERWHATLQQPLMKEMAERERQAGSEEAFEQILAFMRAIEKNTVSAKRLELIHQLDSSTGAADLALESQLAVTRSLLQAINAGLPQDQQLDGQRIARLLADLRNEMAPKVEQITAASLLFAYREAGDEQLAAYLARYHSPEGKWVTEVNRKAVRAALAQASPP